MTTFAVTLTNGERFAWIASNVQSARAGVYSWLCAYRPAGVFIKSVDA
jgi:hypothetical protein